MLRRRVTVVRPYGAAIRRRVFALLTAVGWTVDDEDVIPPHTPDDVALERILASRSRALLVPFHGHRAFDGSIVDGLELLHKLRRARPGFPWRVVMPVSAFGRPALTLALEREPDPTFGGTVLYLEMEGLERPETLARLREHLG